MVRIKFEKTRLDNLIQRNGRLSEAPDVSRPGGETNAGLSLVQVSNKAVEETTRHSSTLSKCGLKNAQYSEVSVTKDKQTVTQGGAQAQGLEAFWYMWCSHLTVPVQCLREDLTQVLNFRG